MLAPLFKDKHIILASQSPRRQELLSRLDIPFEVKTKPVKEDFPLELPAEAVAAFLAEKKAQAFEDDIDNQTIIITADTVVLNDGKVLGKPESYEEAEAVLQSLSGNTHKVVTGVCIQSAHKKETLSVSTTVTFNTLTADEIAYYITQYKPYDKAGSYGIQEWIGYIGIPKIEGSFFNVMGLPVYELYHTLKQF